MAVPWPLAAYLGVCRLAIERIRTLVGRDPGI
jgi:hypothetical protein